MIDPGLLNQKAVLAFPNLLAKRFGKANPDKTFYVIWRRDQAGFFSNFAFVVAHLQLAEALGMIPVVDFQHFPTPYNEATQADGASNSWEYTFEPVSDYSLEEVYGSKNVLFCNGFYPRKVSYSLSQIESAHETISAFITIKKNIMKEVDAFAAAFDQRRTLGVHWRGHEYKTAPGHPFPPTGRQIIKAIGDSISSHRFEQVFLATDEQSYVRKVQKMFPSQVITSDAFRNDGIGNSLNANRVNHRRNLAKEVLIDALVLSRCQGLVCGNSNVSEAALVFNRNKYAYTKQIWNGMNSKNSVFSQYKYFLKNSLPYWLGGFPRHSP